MLIITLAPMAPHFASELWRGFVQAEGRLNEHSCQFQWNKPVLEQRWPQLDEAFKLPVFIRVSKNFCQFHQILIENVFMFSCW